MARHSVSSKVRSKTKVPLSPFLHRSTGSSSPSSQTRASNNTKTLQGRWQSRRLVSSPRPAQKPQEHHIGVHRPDNGPEMVRQAPQGRLQTGGHGEKRREAGGVARTSTTRTTSQEGGRCSRDGTGQGQTHSRTAGTGHPREHESPSDLPLKTRPASLHPFLQSPGLSTGNFKSQWAWLWDWLWDTQSCREKRSPRP